MKFRIEKSRENQNFNLIYREEDYSFDTEHSNKDSFTSILINDLQLEIDEEGKVLYVWGLCPLIKYEEIETFPQEYKYASLIAKLIKKPIPGISYKLNDDGRWPLYINKKRGWVCLGNPKIAEIQMIEFAPKCLATLKNEEMIAIWLHPKKFPAI